MGLTYQDMAVLYRFTFHYVYIYMISRYFSTPDTTVNLHSTMFIFIFVCVQSRKPHLLRFTFHYVYIYIIQTSSSSQIFLIYIPLCLYLYSPPNAATSPAIVFTFHYVYIYMNTTGHDQTYSKFIYIPLCLYLYASRLKNALP